MLLQSYANYKRRIGASRFGAVMAFAPSTDRRGNELRDKGMLDEEKSFIDATFAMAKGGGIAMGPTKHEKSMKIMAIVGRHGLPPAVSALAANYHQVRSASTLKSSWTI